MTLLHEFHLLPETGDHVRQRRELFDPKLLARSGRQRPVAGATLPDDLFAYLDDTLAWVPTEHIWRRGDRGFDPYGQTAVSGEGARVFASVLRAWASVFENGPAELELTGPWEYTVGQPESGRYQKHVLPRDPVVASLKAVAALAEQATSPGLWLLHVGI